MTLSTTKNIEDEYNLQMVLDPRRYSSEKKLLRVTAWIIRFAWNCSTENKVKGSLNLEEIRNAKNCWIREAHTELKRQPNYEQLKLRLGVREVNGILKCFGRLGQSELELETKQPVLLPRNHPLTRLIINSSHDRTLHGGVNITLAEIRRNCWIPNGRQQVKRSTMHCVTCKKVQGKSFPKAQVGELPSIRSTQQARPFERSGVDFAAPLYVKQDGKSNKTYVAIFSCAVTRGMHLALVKDLSTNTLKNELKKFIARRGAPSLMISDNAKTFKATSEWIKKMVRSEIMQGVLENHQIEWKFNQALAPWWGGFYERMVGLVERSLKKALGNARLSYEELEVLITQVEASLNDRPLSYQWEDIETALTPAQLMYGYDLPQIAEQESEEEYVETDVHKRIKAVTSCSTHKIDQQETDGKNSKIQQSRS